MLSIALFKAIESHKINIEKETFAGYTSMLNRFTDWLNANDLNQCTPEAFTKGDAIAFINSLEGLHINTRISYRNTMRGIFNLLIDSGQKFENPFVNIRMPKISRTENKRAFTEEEVQAIKKYCHNNDLHEEWLSFQMIFYCMLRPRKELRLLKVGDIDFKEQRILVRGHNAKNNKQQYIVIPNQLVNTLKQWITDKKRKSSDFMFMNDNGTSRGEDWFTKRCRKILDELNIGSDASLYSWKHTGAVFFYKQTKDIVSLQRQIRHADISETQGYLHSLGLTPNEVARDSFPTI
jgi:site-specific recombinase XerD